MFYLISAIVIIGVSFTIRYFANKNYEQERALTTFDNKNRLDK